MKFQLKVPVASNAVSTKVKIDLFMAKIPFRVTEINYPDFIIGKGTTPS